MYDNEVPDYDDEDTQLSKEDQVRFNALAEIAQSAQSLVHEAVTARNGSRFKEELQRSLLLYNATAVSREDAMKDWEGTRTAVKKGSKVVQNIIRQLCNDGASQLGDMLFPNDDDNYGLDAILPSKPPLAVQDEPAVTHDGEILQTVVDEETQEERPATNLETWQARVVGLEHRAKRMFRRIDGTLDRIKYGRIGRRCLEDAAQTGTGIIKGPFLDPNKDTKWVRKNSDWSLEENPKHSLTYANVKALDFFPDMTAECIEDAAYVNERTWYLPRQLKRLFNCGYIDEQLQKLLAYKPSEVSSVSEDQDDDRKVVKDNAVDQAQYNTRYEVWETWGDFPVEVLKRAGVKIPEKLKGHEEVTACVIHCNQITLKVFVAKQQNTLPYSVWCWDEDPLGIFGKSIPVLAENCQLIYNATWRMIMDHGGLSAMPMITRLKSKVEPADGSTDMDLYGGKIWDIVGDTFDLPAGGQVRPFEVHDIPIHLDQFFAIMDKAEEDAYKITGVTRVDKNETNSHPDNAPVTLGATQIYQNNSTVSRRRQVRNFDDQITATVIQRQYDWYMEHDPDESIKGPMSVEPRGSSVLMQRELNAQNLFQLWSVAAGHPAFKEESALREIQTTMQFPEGRFVESEAETERRRKLEAENPPVDPEIALKERELGIREAELNLANEKAEADAELKQAGLQLEAQVKEAEIQLKAMKDEREHVREMLRLELLDQHEANRLFADIQSKTAQLQVTLKGLQDQRDMKAADIAEKDAESRRKSDAENLTALAQAQNADTQRRELDNKLAGNIEQGV